MFLSVAAVQRNICHAIMNQSLSNCDGNLLNLTMGGNLTIEVRHLYLIQ